MGDSDQKQSGHKNESPTIMCNDKSSEVPKPRDTVPQALQAPSSRQPSHPGECPWRGPLEIASSPENVSLRPFGSDVLEMAFRLMPSLCPIFISCLQTRGCSLLHALLSLISTVHDLLLHFYLI